ncbi:hypothetical protein [Terrabacter sp. BE26]|uniref:hypothetical protein n=1 Tax=Terrabacter sp. BE26 TaxID=2898152 RepID=UPI0035BE4DAF
MKEAIVPVTSPSAAQLRAASRVRDPEWGDAISEMDWSMEQFGFAIGETGRGGPVADYAAFTIGLITRNQQEFITLGVPPEAARLVLVGLGRQVVRHGRSFEICDSPLCDPHEHWVAIEGMKPYDDEEELVVRLRWFSGAAEEQLHPSGLYRSPQDMDRRTPMLQVLVDQFPRYLPAGGS